MQGRNGAQNNHSSAMVILEYVFKSPYSVLPTITHRYCFFHHFDDMDDVKLRIKNKNK